MQLMTATLLDESFEDGVRFGRVSVQGAVTRVCLACCAEARPGDRLLVHAGMAISVVAKGLRTRDRDLTEE